MCKKLAMLLLVLGLCSTTALAVNATWGEEMDAAPAGDWEVAGTVDSTTTPGLWIDQPFIYNPTPGNGYIWPSPASVTLRGLNSPLANKTGAYTLETRFQFTEFTTAQSDSEISWQVFDDGEDGWWDTNKVKWQGYWGAGLGGWNYSFSIANESYNSQNYYMSFGQRLDPFITIESGAGGLLGNQYMWGGEHGAWWSDPFVAGEWYTVRIVRDPSLGLAMFVNDALAYYWDIDDPEAWKTMPEYLEDTTFSLGTGEFGSYPVAWDYVRLVDSVVMPGTALDAVPEPMTMTLLGIGGLALIRRKR